MASGDLPHMNPERQLAQVASDNRPPKQPAASPSTPATPSQSVLQMPEMVAHVLDNLSLHELQACLGVSQAFRATALPRFYRRILLPIADDTPGRSDIERLTTAVELHHQAHTDCAATHPLNFQRLHTVIFHKDEVDEHPGQGPARHNYGIPIDFGHYSCSEPNCLSRDLSPKRVVVRPWMTAGKEKRVFFVPPAPVDTVIHIRRPGPYGYRRDLCCPTSPRHITVVILPSFFGQFKSFSVDGSRQSHTGSKNGDNDSLIGECIAPYVLEYPENSLTIVGLEEANPFASELHWSERHLRATEEADSLRAYLNRLMDGMGGRPGAWDRSATWDDASRRRRQATVHVRTLRDYFESGEWGEELSWQVVGSWLNAYCAREAEDAAATATQGRCGPPQAPTTTLTLMTDIAQKSAPTRRFGFGHNPSRYVDTGLSLPRLPPYRDIG